MPKPIQSAASTAACVLWVIWTLVLPLGHMTGVRNIVSVLAITSVLFTTRMRFWADLPGRNWMIALTFWAGVSIFWSAYPSISFGKLRSDLLIPFGAYVASFLWARSGRSIRPLAAGAGAGLVILALLSAISVAPHLAFDHWLPEANFPTLDRPLPIWYPGVGDASTYAVFILCPFLTWAVFTRRPLSWLSGTILTLIGFIVLVSRNRNTLALFPVAISLFYWLARPTGAPAKAVVDAASRRGRLIRASAFFFIAVITASLIALSLEYVSQERFAESHQAAPGWGNAAISFVAQDPRPRMWKRYLTLGMQHPFIGVGFGRTVPAMKYDVKNDPEMIAERTNGLQHAHNFLIDCWLQLGVVGLALLVGFVTQICRHAHHLAKTNRDARIVFSGIVTLLVIVAVRDMTDDFLVYAMASTFWLALGTLVGLQRAVCKVGE